MSNKATATSQLDTDPAKPVNHDANLKKWLDALAEKITVNTTVTAPLWVVSLGCKCVKTLKDKYLRVVHKHQSSTLSCARCGYILRQQVSGVFPKHGRARRFQRSTHAYFR